MNLGLDKTEQVRIRMDFSYDGTDFHGWAKQPGLRTVQGEIESSLSILLRQNTIDSMTVAGRTDAGVHARGQVCHFDIPAVKLQKLFGRVPFSQNIFSVRRINGTLARHGAKDILINSLKPVPLSFDARFSALARRYEYRLLQESTRTDPLSRHFTVAIKETLNIELMQKFAESLLGLRDFGAFCKPREGATTIRELQVFDWSLKNDLFVARVKADAFCHSMVRTLIGAAVAVGSRKISLVEANKLVSAKKRNSKFKVMPPHGLSLEEIYYPEEIDYETRASETRATRKKELEDNSNTML